MGGLLTDLRHGLRLARKSPVFALVTIATLALGTGANTAFYSLVDAVVVRPLPYLDPDRVMVVWEDASYISFPRNTPAPANYFSWKNQNRVFTDMAATRGASANLTTDGPPEQIVGRRVTANFFSVLGVPPVVGRSFTEEEDRTGAAVTVISYGLWQRRYAGAPEIVGRDVMMNGSRRTIIGVMPREFVFRSRNVDFWDPMHFLPAEIALRSSHFLNVVARLAPGVTLSQARDDMRAVAAQLARDFPDTNRQLGAVVVPAKEDALGDTRLELIVLLGAAGCVLLIACANLAALLLSRGVSRRSELAVRAALGATGARLVRQIVAESMVLALSGGALGLALAPAAMRALVSLVPLNVQAPPTTVLDPAVLVFAGVLAVATGVLFSIVPAVQTVRGSLGQALQIGGRSGVGARAFTRDALVVGQVAVALLLLTGAGLLIRTLANLRGVDIGFRPDHLLTLRTTLPTPKYQDPNDRLAFYESVLAGVGALPGVESAAYASTLPFESIGNTSGYQIEGQAPALNQDALFRVGTADYLKTIGATLVAGRLPDARDGPNAPQIVVINETFARMHWPNGSPLGASLRFGRAADAPLRTIVGVVKDIRERGYELDMKPGAYVPFEQLLTTWLPDGLIVRTSGEPAALAPAVRRVVAEVDPEQPVSAVRSMDEILDLNVADRTGQTALLGGFAALALLLACLGLYGVLSYAVTERTREIGVRLALGASAGAIARLVIGRGLVLTGAGLAAGLGLAWAATRTMRSLLFGVEATDPITLASVVGVLIVVAVASCSLPALRAARVDPNTVLRQN